MGTSWKGHEQSSAWHPSSRSRSGHSPGSPGREHKGFIASARAQGCLFPGHLLSQPREWLALGWGKPKPGQKVQLPRAELPQGSRISTAEPGAVGALQPFFAAAGGELRAALNGMIEI